MDQYEIEKRKNSAENGRCFCVAVAFIMLLSDHPILAFLMVLTIAAAIFVDMLPASSAGKAALVVYLYAAVIAVVSFINLVW